MKILLYVPQPNLTLHSLSGYGTYLREVIKEFEAAGHTVVPLVMGDRGEAGTLGTAAAKAVGRGWKNVVKRFIPRYVWQSLRDFALVQTDKKFDAVLEDTIRREKPDVMFERAAPLQLSGSRVAQKLGLPRVVQMDAPFLHEVKFLASSGSWFNRKAEKIERVQMATADRVNVVSETVRDYFIKEHSLPRDLFFVTHNGVDPDKLRVEKARIEEIKKHYRLDGQFVVGFVGSFFRWHGIDLLIRAAAQLHHHLPGLRLLIVGDGEIAPDLKALTAQLGATSYVLFTGSVPHADVFNHIAAMDVAALPNSHWYGSPIKLFEYGAMGKAVIAPDNGPVREIMQDGEDGLLVAPEAEAVGKAIRQMHDAPDARAQMAETFQQNVLREHTWPRIAAQMLGALEQARTALR